jgi:hypothetical protein
MAVTGILSIDLHYVYEQLFWTGPWRRLYLELEGHTPDVEDIYTILNQCGFTLTPIQLSPEFNMVNSRHSFFDISFFTLKLSVGETKQIDSLQEMVRFYEL